MIAILRAYIIYDLDFIEPDINLIEEKAETRASVDPRCKVPNSK